MSIIAGALPNPCYTDPAYGLEGMAEKEARAQIRFRRNLQALLDERGWKPADLARESGLQPSTISNYLSGQRFPSPESLDVIADTLKVPFSRLFWEVSNSGLDLDQAMSLVRQAIREIKPLD